MLFSIASNFEEAPELHQLAFGLAAVAAAVATTQAAAGPLRPQKKCSAL